MSIAKPSVQSDAPAMSAQQRHDIAGTHLAIAYWAAVIERSGAGAWRPVDESPGSACREMFVLEQERCRAIVFGKSDDGGVFLGVPSACEPLERFGWEKFLLLGDLLILIGLGFRDSGVAIGFPSPVSFRSMAASQDMIDFRSFELSAGGVDTKHVCMLPIESIESVGEVSTQIQRIKEA